MSKRVSFEFDAPGKWLSIDLSDIEYAKLEGVDGESVLSLEDLGGDAYLINFANIVYTRAISL